MSHGVRDTCGATYFVMYNALESILLRNHHKNGVITFYPEVTQLIRLRLILLNAEFFFYHGNDKKCLVNVIVFKFSDQVSQFLLQVRVL